MTAARLARVARVEVREELLAIVREPTALVFSILMPVGFFALFIGLFGTEATSDGVPAGTLMLATFGTFGVLSVTLMNPGIGVAVDRESGWLRVKRVSAAPLPVTLVAKVAAAVPYAVGVLAAMTVAAAATGTLDASGLRVARLVAVLVLGSLPFALPALAVGLRTSSNAAAAVLNAVVIPMAVASGLWMPLDQLPAWVQRIAPALPPYHLAELGRAQLVGGSWADHVAVLLATAVVGAAIAGVAYRRARP